MTSYPNPYSNVIASFNRQSPDDKGKEGKMPEDEEDEDDPQHLPDDDLLLWANAQFTFDNQTPGAGSYEDELALKIAQSQHQQLQAQQFQLQQQQHHHQQQQHLVHNGQFQQHPNLQQPQANALLPSVPLQSQFQHPQHIQHPQHSQHSQHLPHSPQHGSSHVLQPYHPAEMQRQLQQFDAIHGYLDGSTEDPRSSLSLVERSRQRNPVTPGALPQQEQLLQQQLQGQPFDSRLLHSVYAQQQQQQQQQQSTASSGGGSHHQPMVAQQHLQQHFQPYAMAASSSMPSSSMNQFQQPQHHDAQHSAPNSSNSNHAGARTASSSSATMTTTRDRNNSVNASTLSSLSLHEAPSTSAATSAGRTLTSHEEKLLQLETELEVYESELAEERRLQQQEHQHQQQRQSSADMTDAEGDGGPNDSGNDSSAHNAQSPPNAGAPGSSSGGGEYLDAAARLAAEEDKRRRNTAASARFRHKKRLREQILERTAKEMTAKSEILELRVRELEMEIKWLRGLIVEKDAGRGLLVEGANALVATPSSGSGPSSLGGQAGVHLPGLAPRGTGGGSAEGSSAKAPSALRSKRPQ